MKKRRSRPRTRRLQLAALLAALAIGALPAHAQTPSSLEVGIGFDFSSGDYGEPTNTDMLYLPLSLGYRRGPWTLSALLPFLSVEGPVSYATSAPQQPPPAVQAAASPAPAQPAPPPPQPQAPRERAEGVGDVLVGLSYSFESLYASNWYLDLTGKVKIPTARESVGLGTGETDFFAQVDLARSFGAWTPTVMAGYRLVGRSKDLDLRNTFMSSAGLQYALGSRVIAGCSYDYRQSLLHGVADPQEIISYLYVDLGNRASLTVYGVHGLSEGSPEIGLGTALTAGLF